MRIMGWIAGLLLLAASAAVSRELPDRIGYTIFIAGESAGRCEIEVTYTKDGTVILDSTTWIKRGSEGFELRSHSVADARTYSLKRYEYEKIHDQGVIKGEVVVEGTVVTLVKTSGDAPETVRGKADSEPVFVLEDWAIAHEVLLALGHEASGEKSRSYTVVIPSGMMVTEARIEIGATASVESNIKETVCRKLIVQVATSPPFASYFDPGRGLPVYMAFPAVEAEIFLNEFYGDDPVSRWVRREQ